MSATIDPKLIEQIPPALLGTLPAGTPPPVTVTLGFQGYITTVMAVPSLGLIKSSLFIQYYTLFWPLRWVRISVWIGATVSTLFYAACAIAAFVLNSPWPGESMLDALLSWHYSAFSRFSVAIGVVGMLVDLYLLILPIKAVMGLNMRASKKIGCAIVFLTGTLAVIASISGLYYRVKLQHDATDATWRVAYVHIWGLPSNVNFRAFSRATPLMTGFRNTIRTGLFKVLGRLRSRFHLTEDTN
ncbi:MAG: hypothetical protein Q9169_006965 [Polycauliona sp. 2 TL-2023]